MSFKKHIPNVLSTIRLGMAILIPFVFPTLSLSSKLIYFLAGNLTDALDGYLARKWKVQSRYGKIVDPIADKGFNLLALIFSISINPFLLGIVLSEASIATITVLHTINNIKSKNVDMSKLNFSSKMKLFTETADGLSVSRIGRKKAIIMTLSVASAILAALVPVLTLPASLIIILTTLTELPIISRYTTEYYIDKKNYNMESSIECNVTKEEMEKLKKAKELLNRFNTVDKKSDMLDEKVAQKFVKENKCENKFQEEYIKYPSSVDEVNESEIRVDKGKARIYKRNNSKFN